MSVLLSLSFLCCLETKHAKTQTHRHTRRRTEAQQHAQQVFFQSAIAFLKNSFKTNSTDWRRRTRGERHHRTRKKRNCRTKRLHKREASTAPTRQEGRRHQTHEEGAPQRKRKGAPRHKEYGVPDVKKEAAPEYKREWHHSTRDGTTTASEMGGQRKRQGAPHTGGGSRNKREAAPRHTCTEGNGHDEPRGSAPYVPSPPSTPLVQTSATPPTTLPT